MTTFEDTLSGKSDFARRFCIKILSHKINIVPTYTHNVIIIKIYLIQN